MDFVPQKVYDDNRSDTYQIMRFGRLDVILFTQN